MRSSVSSHTRVTREVDMPGPYDSFFTTTSTIANVLPADESIVFPSSVSKDFEYSISQS